MDMTASTISVVLVSVASGMIVGILCLLNRDVQIETWRDFFEFQSGFIISALCSLIIFAFIDVSWEKIFLVSIGSAAIFAFVSMPKIIDFLLHILKR